MLNIRRAAKSFRENLVKAFALDEVFSSLASATPEQERERVFEGMSLCANYFNDNVSMTLSFMASTVHTVS